MWTINVLSLVFIFISRLRFPKNLSILSISQKFIAVYGDFLTKYDTINTSLFKHIVNVNRSMLPICTVLLHIQISDATFLCYRYWHPLEFNTKGGECLKTNLFVLRAAVDELSAQHGGLCKPEGAISYLQYFSQVINLCKHDWLYFDNEIAVLVAKWFSFCNCSGLYPSEDIPFTEWFIQIFKFVPYWMNYFGKLIFLGNDWRSPLPEIRHSHRGHALESSVSGKDSEVRHEQIGRPSARIQCPQRQMLQFDGLGDQKRRFGVRGT